MLNIMNNTLKFKYIQYIWLTGRGSLFEELFALGKDMDEATWKAMYEVVPPFLTQEQRQAWIKKLSNVAVASDAFFPFRDNVDRARQVTTMLYYTWIT